MVNSGCLEACGVLVIVAQLLILLHRLVAVHHDQPQGCSPSIPWLCLKAT